MARTAVTRSATPAVPIFAIVGFLACVEVASGVLQGFYTPIITDIARSLSIHDADFNWFEAGQLIVAALSVPLLARLGDVIGHRTVLLLATVLTAGASWWLAFAPTFTTFLVAWSLQGFYVVWLPMEVAIIYSRTAGDGRRTRLAAGILVGVLEISVIVAALAAGQLSTVMSMTTLLSIPAAITTLALIAIWIGVKPSGVRREDPIDWPGFGMITGVLGSLMAGLVLLRVLGPGSPWPWVGVGASVLLLIPFAAIERRAALPLIDLRVLAGRRQWPIQVTAFLSGASILGAQIPLSTFGRSDPAVTGYGVGATAAQLSYVIGAYVCALAVGALSYPFVARRIGVFPAMTLGASLCGFGYLMFLPWHDSMLHLYLNMVVAGLGSGALVAALPAAAATHAPARDTGFVTGMTNTTKTVGGAIASSVYAIALATTGSIDSSDTAHATLGGYMAVWTICGCTALAAALVLALSGPKADLRQNDAS